MKRIILSLSLLASCLFAVCAPHKGALYGYFIVNEQGDKVIFSKGNLQYQASTNTWRIAEHQYDVVGDATYGNVYVGNTKCNNLLISPTYDGWIDLFGWATNGHNNYYPYMTSTNHIDYPAYTGDATYDWGNNPISNGGNQPYIWHTLSFSEWTYITYNRPNARDLLGKAYIDGVWGVVILPDDWELPTGLSFVSEEDGNINNNYSLEQWALMEENGALFLPGNNAREGVEMVYSNFGEGRYWAYPTTEFILLSATESRSCLYVNYGFKERGQGVRLVRPYSLCFAEYDSIMSEANTLKVTIINHYKDLSDQINAAIQDAEQVAANSNATQKQLDAAARELAAQIAKLEAKVEARKSFALLQNEVQEARDYYNSIKDISEYQEVAAVLLDSIQYAEWVITMSAGDNHTKEYIDEARDKLATDLAKAKTDVAAVNELVFAEEKTAQKAAADSLAKADDSDACDKLIKKAKADIDALAYDTVQTLAENKTAIQAIVTRLEQELKAQRAAELKKSKDALTARIADATTFYNQIKDSTDYAEIAAELNDAIVAAQAILDNPDATRKQLDKATEMLKAAEDKAKEEVARIIAEKEREDIIQTLADSTLNIQIYKVFRNGQIYILRGDHTYILTGAEVK